MQAAVALPEKQPTLGKPLSIDNQQQGRYLTLMESVCWNW